MPINMMTNAEESVQWLQELLDILHMDAYNRDGEKSTDYKIEFSSCCYLDHTIRLIRDHFEKADFSDVPRVHTGTFNYDTGEWEGE